MNARPLYCWKSFWLGLFVLISLGWAWWFSMGSGRSASWSGNTWTVLCMSRRGTLEVALYPDTSLAWGLGLGKVDDDFGGRWFPRPWLVLWDDFGMKVRVAYWFALLVLGMGWGVMMVWRRRRDEARMERERWREMVGE